MSDSAKTKRPTTSSSGSDPEPLTKVKGEAPIDHSLGYLIEDGKQINLAQLTSEIETDKKLNLALSEDERGVVLWVAPRNVAAAAVAQAVADHEANPDWGVPQVLKDYQVVLQKLLEAPDAKLSAAEKDALLRGLALQIQAVSALAGA